MESVSAAEHLQRRRFLLGATAVVGALGVAGAAVPFVRSWSPSAKARAAGAPVTIDLSRLTQGNMVSPMPAWRGKPVFVIYRTEAQVEELENPDKTLSDPMSKRPQQPEYAQNDWRARRPEIGVYLGVCTHLGCSPKFYGEAGEKGLDPNWEGGFFCPCHGSRFDLAGRVIRGVPAPSNLEVPPHYFASDTLIVVGEDSPEVIG
jgi:ubiquinol-cytochrome c reductase iron-sulfur subunit